jgi:hypothetical protein
VTRVGGPAGAILIPTDQSLDPPGRRAHIPARQTVGRPLLTGHSVGRGKSGLHGKTVPANGRRGRPQGQCHRKQTACARSTPRKQAGPAGKGETVRQERTAPLATGAAG